MDEKMREFFESGCTPITVKEFLDGTGISIGCWIFQNRGSDHKTFKTKAHDHPTIYFYDNGLGTVWKFKKMPEYRELWVSKWDKLSEKPEWSMWSTFKIFN